MVLAANGATVNNADDLKSAVEKSKGHIALLIQRGDAQHVRAGARRLSSRSCRLPRPAPGATLPGAGPARFFRPAGAVGDQRRHELVDRHRVELRAAWRTAP